MTESHSTLEDIPPFDNGSYEERQDFKYCVYIIKLPSQTTHLHSLHTDLHLVFHPHQSYTSPTSTPYLTHIPPYISNHFIHLHPYLTNLLTHLLSPSYSTSYLINQHHLPQSHSPTTSPTSNPKHIDFLTPPPSPLQPPHLPLLSISSTSRPPPPNIQATLTSPTSTQHLIHLLFSSPTSTCTSTLHLDCLPHFNTRPSNLPSPSPSPTTSHLNHLYPHIHLHLPLHPLHPPLLTTSSTSRPLNT